MQAVKGYLSNGWFTPSDGANLPNHARVSLVIEEVIEKPHAVEALQFKISEAERQARTEWLDRIEAQLELVTDEDLSEFPKQRLMKNPEDYAWFD